jgi:hypothetical protein
MMQDLYSSNGPWEDLKATKVKDSRIFHPVVVELDGGELMLRMKTFVRQK